VIQAARALEDRPLSIAARKRSAAIALYASLFEPNITSLDLTAIPSSHQDEPELLNVLKTLDVPAAVAMAAERCRVRLSRSDTENWDYPRSVATALHWPKERLEIHNVD
jgi:hypothetical protein